MKVDNYLVLEMN